MPSAFLTQLWVVTGVLLSNLEIGMISSFIASLIPALKEPDSPITPSMQDLSWILSSFGIAMIAGYILSSYFMERFGRKPAFILDMVPGAAGLVVMYFSTNVYGFIAARVLEGITAGGVTNLGAIIIGEYSSPKHRGMFLCLNIAAFHVGSTIVHLLGNLLHWRTVTLCTFVPFLLNIIIIFSWPESPYWLASQKKFDTSNTIFYKLRGKNAASTREIKEIIKAQQGNMEENYSFGRTIANFIKKFGRRDFLKPVFIYVFAAILLETTGRHILPVFAYQIMLDSSGENWSRFDFTFASEILFIVSAILSSIFIRLFKRRTLLFATGFTSVLILLSSCLYLFLASRYLVPNSVWIPISLFGLYFVIVYLGCVPIPLVLIGELFPLEHKAVGTTIAGIFVTLISYGTLYTTLSMTTYFYVYGTFIILGVCMAISLLILYFILPETKDKTLQEIDDYFKGRRFENYDDMNKEELEL